MRLVIRAKAESSNDDNKFCSAYSVISCFFCISAKRSLTLFILFCKRRLHCCASLSFFLPATSALSAESSLCLIRLGDCREYEWSPVLRVLLVVGCDRLAKLVPGNSSAAEAAQCSTCLLYTSDAADERSSV